MGFFKDVGKFVTKNIKSVIKDVGNVANMVVGTASGLVQGTVNPVLQNFDSINISGLGSATISKPRTTESATGNKFNLVDFIKKNKIYVGVAGASLLAALYFIFPKKKKRKRRR